MYVVKATGLDDHRMHSVTARQRGPTVWDLRDVRSLQIQGELQDIFAEDETNPQFCLYTGTTSWRICKGNSGNRDPRERLLKPVDQAVGNSTLRGMSG